MHRRPTFASLRMTNAFVYSLTFLYSTHPGATPPDEVSTSGPSCSCSRPEGKFTVTVVIAWNKAVVVDGLRGATSNLMTTDAYQAPRYVTCTWVVT